MTRATANKILGLVQAIAELSYQAGYTSAKSPTDEPTNAQRKRLMKLNTQLEQMLEDLSC